MAARGIPREPTWLPSTALGWIALATIVASIFPIAVSVSGLLPEESRDSSYFTEWEVRMFFVWLATGVVGTGLGIAALIRGDRSVTAMLIAMTGILASFFMLLGLVSE